jgi:alkanesulfonate monooxygenase SsuD/methylene tetrahydromethanopterin reductase-like flavin-dependent oxidoreductase (luciferase family)
MAKDRLGPLVDVGLTMSTHGLLTRDHRDFILQRLEPEEMRPLELARPLLRDHGRLPRAEARAERPHPPIVFGSVTDVGARRAARTCDGLYPMFLDAYAGRFGHLRDAARR